MVLDCDIDPQWAGDIKYIFDYVYHEFEVALGTLEKAQKKVACFIKSLQSLSEETKKVMLQKITRTQWHALLDALEKCIDDFHKYFSLINSGLDSFKKLMYLSAGNVDGMFLEITEKVLELFISVQIGTEDQMMDIQEIMLKIGIPLPMDES